MLYSIFGPDGQIVQSNKVFVPDDGKYDQQLNDMGFDFVKVLVPGLLSPEEWYVDVHSREHRERPVMSTIEISRTNILPGDADSCVIRGIPKGVKVLITMLDGTVVYPIDHPKPWLLDAEELEISIPTPLTTYRVFFELWPYKKFQFQISTVS